MKVFVFIFFAAVSAFGRECLNMDWRFSKAKSPTFPLLAAAAGMKGFETPDFDDSGWELVSLPHAVNAGDSFDDISQPGGEESLYRGFLFYRKTVELPKDVAEKKVFLAFERVQQTVYLYVNGKFAGYYEAGIAPSAYDISALVNPGKNVIAVATDNTSGRGMTEYVRETRPDHEPGDNSGEAFKWNTKDFNPVQGGLTGNVFLYVKEKAYLTLPYYRNLKTCGTSVTATDFDFGRKSALVTVAAEVRNETGAARTFFIEACIEKVFGGTPTTVNSVGTECEPATDAGKSFLTALEPDAYAKNPSPAAVNEPQVSTLSVSGRIGALDFWSPDAPALYNVTVKLCDTAGKIWDTETVQTGFRDVRFDAARGLLINGKAYYLKGYAQRSTDEWAVIGVGNEWLNDYNAMLVRESGANFIRWMHVAPKPSEVRSCDRFGVVCVCPAGDKEGDVKGRAWGQRMEAMRDAMLAFRNSPSVVFWEAGNNAITPGHMKEMRQLKDRLDPSGGRFIGCRTISTPEQLQWAEYVGTMIHRHDAAASASMDKLGKRLPIVETEYCRDESPRRCWDDFTPPDYDYVNKWLGSGKSAKDFDTWDETQEDFCRSMAGTADGYGYFYGNRVGGQGAPYYVAAAMLCWTDSNQHTRNSATENCRASGRVDPARNLKEAFSAAQVLQADRPRVKILGHWNYPKLADGTYNYKVKEWDAKAPGFWRVTGNLAKRDPLHKTVYVLASVHCAAVELLVNGKTAGRCEKPDGLYVYPFPNVDVTQSGVVRAVAYGRDGKEIAGDSIYTAGVPAALKIPRVWTAPNGLRADGADIALVHVAVVDGTGRVCPTATNRLDFKLEGPATLLGGYNSGAKGIKPPLYAECGSNAVFIRAGRKAETLRFTVSSPGLQSAATEINVAEALNAEPQTLLDPSTEKMYSHDGWTGWTRELGRQASQEEIYAVTVNGKTVTFPNGGTAYKPDGTTGVVGPVRPVLEAVKAAGAAIDVEVQNMGKLPSGLRDFSLPLVALTVGKNRILMVNGETSYVIGKEKTLTNYQFVTERGELVVELPAILACVPGVETKTDEKAKVLSITVKAE